jgi:hypothetical protein
MSETPPPRVPGKLWPFYKPRRSLAVAGISRSGTSLLCALINELENAVCFNEVLPSDIDKLPAALARARRDLLERQPVQNKYADDGSLTTNTLERGVAKKKRVVEKPLDEDVVVASKRNIPYLTQLDALLELELPVVVLIRDPVYALGSWGSSAAVEKGIPGARIGPDDTHPHWSALALQQQDPIRRRAEAWQACAERILERRARLLVLRYEDLCGDPRAVVARIAELFSLELPSRLETWVTAAKNDDQRYPDVDRIKEAVFELCPARRELGYA